MLKRDSATGRPAWLDSDLDAFAGAEVRLELVNSTGLQAYAFPRRIPDGVLVTFADHHGMVTCSIRRPGGRVEHGLLGARPERAFPHAADWPKLAVRLVSSPAGEKSVVIDEHPAGVRVTYMQRGVGDERPQPMLGSVRLSPVR